MTLSGVIPPEMPQTETVAPDGTSRAASSADIRFVLILVLFSKINGAGSGQHGGCLNRFIEANNSQSFCDGRRKTIFQRRKTLDKF
jgi:hypothetical protein